MDMLRRVEISMVTAICEVILMDTKRIKDLGQLLGLNDTTY